MPAVLSRGDGLLEWANIALDIMGKKIQHTIPPASVPVCRLFLDTSLPISSFGRERCFLFVPCVVIFLSYSNQILMLRESKMPTAEEILLACARGCYKKIFQQVFFRNISLCFWLRGEFIENESCPLMASFIRTRYLCYFVH